MRDSIDRSGDSPLELAASRGIAESTNFLTEHGAKRIRGDEAQHKKAISDQVRESIDELNHSEAADKKLQENIRKAEREQGNP